MKWQLWRSDCVIVYKGEPRLYSQGKDFVREWPTIWTPNDKQVNQAKKRGEEQHNRGTACRKSPESGKNLENWRN